MSITKGPYKAEIAELVAFIDRVSVLKDVKDVSAFFQEAEALSNKARDHLTKLNGTPHDDR